MANLNILQWNIRSFRNNKDSLINFVRDHDLHIIALSETFMNDKFTPSIRGFDCVHVDRDDGFGGVAFFIMRDIKYDIIDLSHINLPHRVQVIALECSELIMLNFYNPPDLVVSLQILNDILSFLNTSFNKPYLWMGDFNAQHPLWGSGYYNRSGCLLEEFISANDFIVLNSGSATRLTTPSQRKSAPDVTFCSPGLVNTLFWEVLGDTGSSDHFPCLITALNSKSSGALTFSTRVFSTKKANWVNYDSVFDNIYDPEDKSYDNLINSINEAAKESIPQVKHKPNHKVSNIWWNDECEKALKERRKALQIYKRDSSMTNFINFLKMRALARRTFRKNKKESFRNFCESLSPKASISFVWGTIKKFSACSNPKRLCPSLNNNIARDLLATISQPVFDFTLPPLNFRFEISQPFSIDEVKFSLNSKTDSAPGLDGVTYSMIKNLPMSGIINLTHILNALLRGESSIPPSWKNQVLIPIPKPGRDPNSISGWRPIILSSCMGKLAEDIIKNRIMWDLENRNTFCEFFFGFRKGRGTSESLVSLYSIVSEGLSESQKVVAVFLDLKSAYDNVLLSKVYESLCNVDIPTDLSNLVIALLQNRQIKAVDPASGGLVGPETANRGLPQGSPLSPLLFNILCNPLKDLNWQNCTVIGYADDFVVLGKDTDVVSLVQRINSVLIDLSDFFSNLGLTLSPEKCSAICFKNPRCNNPINNVLVNGQVLQWKQECKYLGVIFHHNLSWKLHIEYVIGKALKGINVMRFLSRTWWGASPSVLLLIYKSLVRPHLDYGSLILGKYSKSLINKLDKIQLQALRPILGYMRSTPTNIILSETGEKPLEERRLMLALNFVAKILSYENPVGDCLRILRLSYIRNPQYWPERSVPPILRAFLMLMPYVDQIFTSYNFPCFLFPLSIITFPLQIFTFNLPKDENNKFSFLYILNTRFPDFISIFTDGSKDMEGRTAYAVYIHDRRYYKERLPDQASIYDAEIQAIYRACLIIEELDLTKAIIISDSLSALKSITTSEINGKNDYWALKIKEKIVYRLNSGSSIVLSWVPSHSSIFGNDKADKLANEARQLDIIANVTLPFSRFPSLLKENIRISWRRKFHSWSNLKGKTYAQYNQNPLEKPWFLHLSECPRKTITTLSRLRSNHCLTMEHLWKLKIKNSPNCECGELQNINHIFFACELHLHNINTLISALKFNDEVQFPLTIHDVLFRFLNMENASLIMDFLTACNIKL